MCEMSGNLIHGFFWSKGSADWKNLPTCETWTICETKAHFEKHTFRKYAFWIHLQKMSFESWYIWPICEKLQICEMWRICEIWHICQSWHTWEKWHSTHRQTSLCRLTKSERKGGADCRRWQKWQKFFRNNNFCGNGRGGNIRVLSNSLPAVAVNLSHL